ncbi:MAG: tyrosine-type recombinase/integrase [Acidimicrobiia bacterium]
MALYGRGGPAAPSRRTLADYLEREWLPVQEARLRPSTFHGYRRVIQQQIIPLLGSIRLSDLTAGAVAAFLQDLRSSTPRRNGAPALSEQSIKRAYRVLFSALAHAVELGLVVQNAAARVPRSARPRPPRKEMRVWSADELRKFLDATADDRLHALFVLAATSGLRRSEILGLRWDDVDLDTGTLAVRRARVAAGYDVFEGETKSGCSRLVRIPEGTVAALRVHRTAQLEERLAWGASWTDMGYLATREDGLPLHPHSLTDAFERKVRAIDVPVIRFHDLRHTCATLLLQAEVHPKVVQEMLGHSSIAITLDIYSHVVPSMQDEAADRLNAMVFGHR